MPIWEREVNERMAPQRYMPSSSEFYQFSMKNVCKDCKYKGK